MTYTPLWPDWVTQTREALALVDEVPEDSRVAMQDLAVYVGEELRMEFADVDPRLVGWIALRAASHIGGLVQDAPVGMDLSTIVVVGLLAGDHLTGGGR